MSVAFDAVGPSSSGQSYLAVASTSWTHTPVGTPTAVAIGECAFALPAGGSTATYGGTSMTAAGISPQSGNNDFCRIWGLANPTSGAQTVALAWSGGSGGVEIGRASCRERVSMS